MTCVSSPFSSTKRKNFVRALHVHDWMVDCKGNGHQIFACLKTMIPHFFCFPSLWGESSYVMLAGVIQCLLPSLHGEVPHLAHAGLLLVIQVAQVSLCYAGLSCQYANLLLWASSVTCRITLFHRSFILIRGWFSEKGGTCRRYSGSHKR